MADRAITSTSSYADRLFALIPGEITAAYTAIHATVDPTSDKYNRLLIFAFVVLLVLNVPYLRKFQGVTDVMQIAFTCGAFILWVAGIENTRLYEAGFDPTYVSVILILYTLGAPFLIKPSSRKAKRST
jgi:hypothetical protein